MRASPRRTYERLAITSCPPSCTSVRGPWTVDRGALDCLFSFPWWELIGHLLHKMYAGPSKKPEDLVQPAVQANKEHQYALKVYTERLEAELEHLDKLLVSQ